MACIADAWFQQVPHPKLAPVPYSAVVSGSDWIASDPGQQVTLRMADCLAAREPERVEAVLVANWNSPAEAIQALAPYFGTCLETGVSLTAKKAGLRLALASAMDRRLHEPLALGGKN